MLHCVDSCVITALLATVSTSHDLVRRIVCRSRRHVWQHQKHLCKHHETIAERYWQMLDGALLDDCSVEPTATACSKRLTLAAAAGSTLHLVDVHFAS